MRQTLQTLPSVHSPFFPFGNRIYGTHVCADWNCISQSLLQWDVAMCLSSWQWDVGRSDGCNELAGLHHFLFLCGRNRFWPCQRQQNLRKSWLRKTRNLGPWMITGNMVYHWAEPIISRLMCEGSKLESYLRHCILNLFVKTLIYLIQFIRNHSLNINHISWWLFLFVC